MKTSHLVALPATVFAMTIAFTATSRAVPGNGNAYGNSDPLIPVGSVSAYPTIVRTGTYPTLTWGINYPQNAKTVVVRDPDGTLTPKEDLYMDIRVLGASYQIGTNRGKPVWGTVETYVRPGGSSSFTRVFQGVQTQVDPTVIAYTTLVPEGLPIDIRSRCHNGSSWLPYRSTESLTPNVVALLDGETPPNTVPAFQQGEIESFLRPYLDNQGRIDIGPMDVIYLFELGQTNPNASGFDLQDLVVLVTFRNVKNNNGHGNNLDGVDVSNPGQGGGGPTGAYDPSGIVDDEGKAVKP